MYKSISEHFQIFIEVKEISRSAFKKQTGAYYSTRMYTNQESEINNSQFQITLYTKTCSFIFKNL